jgi:hypothetical protein
MRRREMIMEHDDDDGSLRDCVYDAILAGRHSLQVAYVSPKPESGAAFSVSFTLSIDNKTHKKLSVSADRKQRSVPSLVRRYAKDCFRHCISAVDDDAAQLKDAA